MRGKASRSGPGGEIGEAPPVADAARRFRGSAPIGGRDSGRQSVGTTVGKRTPPLRVGYRRCGTAGRCGERTERCRWQRKRSERVAAVKISSVRRKAAQKFWAPQQDHRPLRNRIMGCVGEGLCPARGRPQGSPLRRGYKRRGEMRNPPGTASPGQPSLGKGGRGDGGCGLPRPVCELVSQ